MRWFAGAVLLLLAALVLESGLLAYAMYVLLALLLVSRMLARSWIENLDAARQCNRTSAEVGETVAVNVVVSNRGRLPVPWVLLEDVLPSRGYVEDRWRLKVRKKRLKIAMLSGSGTTTLNYQVEFKVRGYYQLGPLVLEGGDLFGLHRRYRVGTHPHFVLVYPKVIPLEGYDLASRRPLGELRLAHRLYEDPTRIAGVRGYEAGDPLNRIHWRATARTGSLHCKVYEPSCLAGATVLLDFHEGGYPAKDEPNRSELAVIAAASLANAVYQTGEQIGLVTNGRDAADRVREEGWAHDHRTRKEALASAAPGTKGDRLRPIIVPTRRGIEQFERIRETLARVELTDGLSFAELIVESASRLPRDATVIAVLGTVPDETALALADLRRRGYAVTAVLIALSEDDHESACRRLIAAGVEVRHVPNEESLTNVCQRQALVY